MAKQSRFQDINNPFLVQQTLFLPTSVREGLEFFPPLVYDKAGLQEILQKPEEGLGLDLEFDPDTGKPSILGISNRHLTGAIPWDSQLAREVVEVAEKAKVEIVGHSVVGADRPILEGALGIKTPLKLWDDTLIRFYLCNPDFCKTPGKEEDDDDTGAMGFMGLWTMASIYTDVPAWKTCRGKACEGPCPKHYPFDYCAVDSWTGLMAKFGLVEEMKEKKIPEKLHRDLMELSEITYLMETRGIKIDRDYVNSLESRFESDKAQLFPQEDGKHAAFNPRSPAQIKDYFAKNGLTLADTDKKSIRKALEKEIKARKLDGNWILPDRDSRDIVEILEIAGGLPEPVASAYRLYKYKESGKGLSSWFDSRYLDAEGFVHPRFIVPGTSMGRLASSRPNFTNIPARGFGARIKQSLVPRDSSLDIVKADSSQLEMRVMLHYGGYDLNDLASDPFAGLVERSKGAFKPAADFMHGKERDVAKSLVHANNYGEGVIILSGKELEQRKREIDAGALLVYRDWEYRGGLVGFTGGNLAERLFGNKTWESRKKALELQELVNEEFPWIRRLHRKIALQIEERKGIQLETGRFLPLYGSPEDDFKMGTAAVGQGSGADYIQSVMLRYYREHNVVPLLMIHDELSFEIPKAWSDKQAIDFMKLMEEPTERLQGFWCPAVPKRGPNLGSMRAL